MSENNPEEQRTARERLRIEREREQTREKRRRTLVALSAVAGVLALVAGTGFLVSRSAEHAGSDKPMAYPQGAVGEDRLALPAGKADASATLTVYEDFRCPACGQFEQGFSETIHELVEAGKLKSEYRLVTLIDGNFGGQGSLTAANAAACAQDAGRFVPYHDLLYQSQPEETDDAFADKKWLKKLAGKVEGLRGKAFETCVDEGRYDSWVQKSDAAFDGSGHASTPTVLLNGESIYGPGTNLTPERLKQLVEAAARA